jgi:RNA polymerase sigma-70 factor, ECF subfamily
MIKSNSSIKPVSQLLAAWNEGDETALDRLTPLVYDELHRMAARYMRRESPDHTLQTSALVNEAYLKLVDQRSVRWQNRSHFFAIAAKLLRRVLVDHARANARVKRGGDAQRLSIDAAAIALKEPVVDLIKIDEALKRLAVIDAQKSRIVEMKFFGGLSTDEIGVCLNQSSRTIEREWRKAKAWLRRELEPSIT